MLLLGEEPFLCNCHPPTTRASLFHTVFILLLCMTEHPPTEPTSSLFSLSTAVALRDPLRNINDVCSHGGETKRRVRAAEAAAGRQYFFSLRCHVRKCVTFTKRKKR